ncbi:CATSPER1 [Symbiodinium natans]|uniref:CATSPER1 protein n=1 Tax=Symbiodinium natans TaxID=878477 RepID=A0A812JND8_9DINO|nr:CATSPER1 [Symbiodinium natans]
MARGSGRLAAFVGGCALAGGLAFVPGMVPVTRTTPSPNTHAGREQADFADASSFQSLQGLFGGVALGLLLSVASASPVLAEEAAADSAAPAAPAAKELSDDEILAKGCDIRVDCKTQEEQFRWAKAYYRKYNRETDGKDPKYSQASTGAGTYRKYKVDLYIENPGIADTTDGTYQINPAATAFEPIWKEYNKQVKARIESVYGHSDEPIRWNGDYCDNKLSPYKTANCIGIYTKKREVSRAQPPVCWDKRARRYVYLDIYFVKTAYAARIPRATTSESARRNEKGMVELALVGTCALTGSLVFVPGLAPKVAPSPAPRVGQQEVDLQAGEEASSFSSLTGLFGGVALGLLLSVASASPVLAEEAAADSAAPAAPAAKELSDDEILAKGCDIRVDCKTQEEQFRWAKAYYRKYNRETDGKDPKYSQASTGAGTYRKYKVDLYIENPGIADTTDGTYQINPAATAFEPIWKEYNKQVKARIESVYGHSDEPIRWNGDYCDNKLSPYKTANCIGIYNK